MPKLNRAIEFRYHSHEVEIRGQGAKIYAEGYASVFERRSNPIAGLFVEQVKPTAFTKTLAESDVRALVNHDPQKLLGRMKSGTLEISTDTTGLYYRALLPNTTYANDLAELLHRRDITQSSFGFFVVNEEWDLTDDDMPIRSLVEVGLVEVSPVTWPAYEDSTSALAMRKASLVGLEKRCGTSFGDSCTVDAIREAVKTTIKTGPDAGPSNDTPIRFTPEMVAAEEARFAALQTNWWDVDDAAPEDTTP